MPISLLEETEEHEHKYCLADPWPMQIFWTEFVELKL